jgi:hypothetical protein
MLETFYDTENKNMIKFLTFRIIRKEMCEMRDIRRNVYLLSSLSFIKQYYHYYYFNAKEKGLEFQFKSRLCCVTKAKHLLMQIKTSHDD